MHRITVLAIVAAGLALPAAAQTPKPKPAPVAAATMPKGDYECWAYSSPRMLLNFTVTAPGKYRASDGSMGTFSVDPKTKAVTLTGYLKNVMPDGFKTVYRDTNNKPTLSFIGTSGSEASFCEKAR
ncbi:hypothetical protein PQU92_00055 [Asticcacaulis sp. BYS171W]|uniref:C-type lysozyme inhibitor domain-containing protein n=1 Tax=Asticcacaulis aquaticus TaxID=2984212 RepID=A0ABT5HNM2_9CAUL|nr:hypothetical protein [Asticcacaulis aquaticus]MDC7681655.1 hypothetical protein [Asticcacaulis aquaticus]